MRKIKIGTRGSALAMVQTNQAVDLLKRHHPNQSFEIVEINTAGDLDASRPLVNFGAGAFTARLEQELLVGNIDAAVHSAKDLPSSMNDDLKIAAVPSRGPVEDVWLSRHGISLKDSKAGTIVGTSSPRRRAQLLNMRPDFKVQPIRGNIETRLDKLKSGQYDAIVLAKAGLVRLGLRDNINEILPPESFIPAPGQGALAFQIRAEDKEAEDMFSAIKNPQSLRCLEIERGLMRKLNAGCSTPLGALAVFDDKRITLRAVVLDPDGRQRLYAENKISASQSDGLLINNVIEKLMAQGAGSILAEYHG